MTIEEDKQEFITNFAIELTNRTLYERKQIAEKYYNIIQRLKKENEDLKFYIDSYSQVWELIKFKQALEGIRDIAEKIYKQDKCNLVFEAKEIMDKCDNFLNNVKINEVLADVD